jgi:hypothetical protein
MIGSSRLGLYICDPNDGIGFLCCSS